MTGKITQVLFDAVKGSTPVNESLKSVYELLQQLNWRPNTQKSLLQSAESGSRMRQRVNYSYASVNGSMGLTKSDFDVEFPDVVTIILLQSGVQRESMYQGQVPQPLPNLLEKLDQAFYEY